VFSDANSLYAKSTVRHLVGAFEDPEVGYATGRLLYMNPGESASAASCSAYMRYENGLRRLETRIGSIVGVNGGVDAVRRSLYAPMRPDHLPDFILPLLVVEQGYRVVFCSEAVSREEALQATEDEFRMRVRVGLRALRALVEMRRLLSVRHGRFAFQLLVHKALRYTLFVPLIAAFVANALLGKSPGYRAVLAAHGGFYAVAILGVVGGGRGAGRFLNLPAFFLIVNVASAVALAKLLRGERQVQWQPRKGA